MGALADALAAFYDGHRTRILITAGFGGMRSSGELFLLLITVSAALAYSIAGSGNQTLHRD